jgi:hypothetical protein
MQITVRADRRWASIICALFLATTLAACSTTRLAYNNAPTLLYYWLDAYFDFDGPQNVAMKDSLRALQAWHRKNELPLLAEQLRALQPMALQDASAEQICTQYGLLRQRLQAPLAQLTPTLARLAGSLKPTQLSHIEAEFSKRNQRWREEWLDPAPEARLEHRSSQLIERLEKFYGTLDKAQRAAIRSQLAASAYDAEQQHREMLRRQQDTLQTLAQLRNGQFAAPAAEAAVQALLDRALDSPDPAARRYSQSMAQSMCAGLAALHQSATPAQRKRLQETLQGYEADARALVAQAQAQTGQTTP